MRLILVALVLFAFWLIFSGHFTPLFLGLGIASVLGVILMRQRLMRVVPFSEQFATKSRLNFLKSVRYFFWLVGQIIISNFAMARIILSPRLNIKPHFVEVPVKQKTLLGEVIFANSVTLTPGTISAETGRKNYIKIHALNEDTGNVASLNEMSERVCQIEKTND